MLALLDEVTRSRNPSAPGQALDWPMFVGLSQDAGTLVLRSSFAGGGWTPLHCTAFYCKPQYCELLLARGADPNAADASLGRSPLHICAFMARWQPDGALATARVLLLHGADVNAAMEGGKDALIEAVSSGCEEMVRLMLDAGARMDGAVTYGGRGDAHTALYLALYTGREEVVRLLVAAGARLDDDRSRPSARELAKCSEDVRRIVDTIEETATA
jgi:ankyrin repeat protein